MRKHVPTGLMAVAMLAALPGCGGSTAAAPPTASTTITATITATPSTPTVEPSTEMTPSPEISGQSSAGPNVPADPSGPPVLTGITTAPKKLVLADIFSHEYWQEGLIGVPNRAGTVQSMYTRVTCSGRRVLELRFADQGGTLRADLAQALDSPTSGTTVEFKLLADGRLVDTALVKFNGQGQVETSLVGVSSVQLEARAAVGSQVCTTTAAVTDLSVTPAAS